MKCALITLMAAAILSGIVLPALAAVPDPEASDEVELERHRSRDPVYIAKRELIHIVSAPGAYLVSFYIFWVLGRKVRWFPEFRGYAALIVPALAALLVIFLREPADVARGSWVGKSYIDDAVWFAAIGFLGAFALYKITPRLATIYEEIQEQKRQKKRRRQGLA